MQINSQNVQPFLVLCATYNSFLTLIETFYGRFHYFLGGQKNQGANPRQVVMTVTNSDEKRMRWNFICNLRTSLVTKILYFVVLQKEWHDFHDETLGITKLKSFLPPLLTLKIDC